MALADEESGTRNMRPSATRRRLVSVIDFALGLCVVCFATIFVLSAIAGFLETMSVP